MTTKTLQVDGRIEGEGGDLRKLYNALCGEPLLGVPVKFVLPRGRVIHSKRADMPALRTGDWPMED